MRPERIEVGDAMDALTLDSIGKLGRAGEPPPLTLTLSGQEDQQRKNEIISLRRKCKFPLEADLDGYTRRIVGEPGETKPGTRFPGHLKNQEDRSRDGRLANRTLSRPRARVA